MQKNHKDLRYMTGLLAVFLISSSTFADVAITTDTAAGEVAAQYVAGDTEFVTFYVNGEAGRAIYGVDFELEATDANVLIRSIEFNPAFSKVVGAGEFGGRALYLWLCGAVDGDFLMFSWHQGCAGNW